MSQTYAIPYHTLLLHHNRAFPISPTTPSIFLPPPLPLIDQVNALFGSPLSKDNLVIAGLRSEATVSGYHADNVGPALLGGFVLIRSYDPLEILQLPYPEDSPLFFVVASPAFEAPTKAMRAALPAEVCAGLFHVS